MLRVIVRDLVVLGALGLAACGSPAAPAAVHLSASTLDLPPTLCGTTQTTRVELDNPGGSPLHWDALVEELPGATITPPSGTLEPGAHVALEVSVPSPTDKGLVDLRGRLVVRSDAAESTRLEVPVAMRTTGAVLRFTKAGLDFGWVPAGATSPALPVSVANDGDVPIDVNADVRPPFSVAWESGLRVDPGKDVAAQVRFSPDTTDDVSALLGLATGPGVCGAGGLLLVGKGVDGVVGVTPGMLDFGDVDCAGTAQANVVVTNTSKTPFVASLTLQKTGSPYTLVVPSAMVFAESPVTLPVKVDVGAVYDGNPADYANALTVVTTAPKDVLRVLPLTTAPRGARLRFSAPAIDLGPTRVDLAPAAAQISLENLGNVSATVSLQLAAPFAAPASVAVPAGAKISIPVTRGAALELGIPVTQTLATTTADVTCAPPPSVDLTSRYTDRALRMADGYHAVVVAASGHVYERKLWPAGPYTRVPGLSGVTAEVAVYSGASCARLVSGGVRCWGQAPLGNGTASSQTPVDVTGISTAISIDAREDCACAVLADGTVRCWGYSGNCLFGDCSTGSTLLTPQPLPNLSNVSKMALGGSHQCALFGTGRVACWGYNLYGQIGDGIAYGERPIPTILANPIGVTSVVAGQVGTCAITSTAVWCWGEGLPLGHPWQSPVPVQVFGGGVVSADMDNSAGTFLTVVGTSSGPTLWGVSQTFVYAPLTQVTARRGLPCILRQDGRIACDPGPGATHNYIDEPGFD